MTVTVRVYQTAGLPPGLEEQALTEAMNLFRAARVEVRWQKCTGPNPSTVCVVPTGPSDLLLVVRDATRCEDARGTLGNAVVVPREGGVLATVYSDHVGQLASQMKTDAGVLLGRVAAHELGHLIMRTAAHRRRGLMRANWTPFEIRRSRPPDWAFTAADVAAMRPD